MPNIFTDSDVCELGVTFMASGRKFSDFMILSTTQKKKNIYMSHFLEIFKDQYNRKRKREIFSVQTKREFG